MKFIFFVQGEGRGHLSQAITLKEKLEKRGHLISAVFVSSNPNRKIPDFFSQRMGLQPILIGGPVFVIDKNNQGINSWLSFLATIKNIFYWPKYLKIISQTIKKEQPDILISFYEPLSRVYQLFCSESKPLFLIGHQFFVEHSSFQFPKKTWLEKNLFLFYNYFLAGKKNKKIALSFLDVPDENKKNLFICPPLIKKEIKNCLPEKNDYIMAYLLNKGYAKEIETWAQKNPGSKIEAFSDREEKSNLKNLSFNPVNDLTFAECLRKCSIYISTAGFDSIGEALYLDKDILMIPTKNHYEQLCNAYDATQSSLASMGESFDPQLISANQKTQFKKNREIFKNWVDFQDNKIIDILENNL